MRKELSDLFLQNVRPPKEGRDDYTDKKERGLILRVSYTGERRWSVVYRITGAGGYNPATGKELKGPQQRISLGSYPRIGLADARRTARDIRDMADEGLDPKAKRVADARDKHANSVQAIADQMMELARVELRKPRNLESILRNHILPRFGPKPIKEVSHADINNFLTGPVAL